LTDRGWVTNRTHDTLTSRHPTPTLPARHHTACACGFLFRVRSVSLPLSLSLSVSPSLSVRDSIRPRSPTTTGAPSRTGSAMFRSAPAVASSCKAPVWPFSAAKCAGVQPLSWTALHTQAHTSRETYKHTHECCARAESRSEHDCQGLRKPKKRGSVWGLGWVRWSRARFPTCASRP
jgi:hypothetical protein